MEEEQEIAIGLGSCTNAVDADGTLNLVVGERQEQQQDEGLTSPSATKRIRTASQTEVVSEGSTAADRSFNSRERR